jgi:hypothetical protein
VELPSSSNPNPESRSPSRSRENEKKATPSSTPKKETCSKECNQGENCAEVLGCNSASRPSNDKLQDFSFKITDDKAPATAPLVTNDNTIIGSIHVAPGTFPKGTILIIEPQKKEVPSENEDRCSSQTQASYGFTITARSPKDKNKKLQPKKPVTLRLAADKKLLENLGDGEEICLGFQNDDDKENWKCEGNIKQVKKPHVGPSGKKQKLADKSKYTYIEGTTSHFSTFAVLLLGSSQANGCKESYWLVQLIVSLCIISAFVLFAILGVYWPWLANKIRGNKGKSMKQVQHLIRANSEARLGSHRQFSAIDLRF